MHCGVTLAGLRRAALDHADKENHILLTCFHLLADMVVFLHCAFVLFVLFGGAAALRWRHILWIHAPAALWGAIIELGGWVCPLTYLENSLRRMGGGPGYDVTFIERYLEPVLYPLGLTRHTQIIFGLAALGINLAIYYRFWKLRRISAEKIKIGDR